MKAMLGIVAIVAAVFMLFFYGVGDEASEALPVASPALQAAHGGETPQEICSGPVLETMSSGGYTYVRVDCGDHELWAAGPQTRVAVGDRVSLPPGQEMRDFQSPTLDRSFETILFVPSIELGGSAGASGAVSLADVHGSANRTVQAEVDLADIERPAGAKTVAEIFWTRTALEGTEVVVLGKVVKYSPMIMGQNWIHLQDGTGEPGANDLTITTQAVVSVGDTVLVRGTVGLDKDIGAGYRYEVLIEDATVTIQ
jgi:hypothetical protein